MTTKDHDLRIDNDVYSINRALKVAILKIDKLFMERDEPTNNKNIISTGFKYLDKKIKGWSAGELIALCGVPYVGKTTLLLHFIEQAVTSQNHPVIFFSPKHDAESLMIRLLGMKAKLNTNKLREGDICDEDWGGISKAVALYKEKNLFIVTPQNMKLTEIGSHIQTVLNSETNKSLLDKENTPALIVIDDFHLCDFESGDGQIFSTESAESYIRGLIKEYDCPVIVSSELPYSDTYFGVNPKRSLSNAYSYEALSRLADSFLLLNGHCYLSGPFSGLTCADKRSGSVNYFEYKFNSDTSRLNEFKTDVASTHIDQFDTPEKHHALYESYAAMHRG